MTKKYRFDEISFGWVFVADTVIFILQLVFSPLWIGNWCVLVFVLTWRLLLDIFIKKGAVKKYFDSKNKKIQFY